MVKHEGDRAGTVFRPRSERQVIGAEAEPEEDCEIGALERARLVRIAVEEFSLRNYITNIPVILVTTSLR